VRKAGIRLAALAAAAGVAAGVAATARAATPGANGRIAFDYLAQYSQTEQWPFDARLESVLPTGHGVRTAELCGGCLQSTYPAYSPDGRRIAFTTPAGIWTAQADGSRARLACADDQSVLEPAWSPDGRSLVVVRGRLAVDRRLYVVTLRTCRRRAITPGGQWELAYPAWSVRGVIAYSHEDGSLWTVRPDGTGRRRLLSGALHADWSPDGRRIVFEGAGARHGGVWIASAAGRGARRVVGAGRQPVFSPDGRRIAFLRDGAASVAGLWTSRADGRGRQRLVATGALTDPTDPSWQPLRRRR